MQEINVNARKIVITKLIEKFEMIKHSLQCNKIQFFKKNIKINL